MKGKHTGTEGGDRDGKRGQGLEGYHEDRREGPGTREVSAMPLHSGALLSMQLIEMQSFLAVSSSCIC